MLEMTNAVRTCTKSQFFDDPMLLELARQDLDLQPYF